MAGGARSGGIREKLINGGYASMLKSDTSLNNHFTEVVYTTDKGKIIVEMTHLVSENPYISFDGSVEDLKFESATVKGVTGAKRSLYQDYIDIEKNEYVIREQINSKIQIIEKNRQLLNSSIVDPASKNKLENENLALSSEVNELAQKIFLLEDRRRYNERVELAKQTALMQQMADTQRRAAEAAERHADAADQANFQNNLNSNNTLLNSLNNSTQIQMYQPPRATAPTYYNRVGNSLMGTNGTTCTGIGNSIVCR